MTPSTPTDWSTLSHAFGPAVDIPEWIEGTRSGDPEAREWLLRSLNVEGLCFPATPRAVPLIVSLIEDPEVPARDTLLIALGEWSGSTINDRLDTADPPVLPADGIAGTSESAATRTAIAAALPTFLRTATDPHEPTALRCAAFHLIASLGNESAETRACIEAAAHDPDSNVRASAVLALGKRAAWGQLSAQERDCLLRHELPLLRAAASISFHWSQEEPTCGPNWDSLVEAACAEEIAPIPGWGELRLCAGARVFERRHHDSEKVIQALERALEPTLSATGSSRSTSRERQAHTVASAFAEAMGQLVFASITSTAEIVTRSDLSEPQQRFLERCGEADLAVPVESIPYSGAKLTRLATGAGPLEEDLRVGRRSAPTWLWLLRFIEDEVSEATLVHALSSERTPDQLIALLGDLWTGAYGEPGMNRADGHPALKDEVEALVLETLKPFRAELEKELAGRAGVALSRPAEANIWEARAIVRWAAARKGLPTIPRYDPARLAGAWEVLVGRALSAGLSDSVLEAIPIEQRSRLVGHLGPVGLRYWHLVDRDTASEAVANALVDASPRELHVFSTYRARRFLAQLDPSVVPELRAATEKAAKPKRRLLKQTIHDLTKPSPFRLQLEVQGKDLQVTLRTPTGETRARTLPRTPTLRQMQGTFATITDADETALLLTVSAPPNETRMLVQRWKQAAAETFLECREESDIGEGLP